LLCLDGLVGKIYVFISHTHTLTHAHTQSNRHSSNARRRTSSKTDLLSEQYPNKYDLELTVLSAPFPTKVFVPELKQRYWSKIS